MDQDRTKRIQSFRIIASEIVMVIAVILTVLILILIVSGYWLGADFKVERQGLLQISSVPTGADVDIDGDSSWFQRTNTSKTLSSGEHTVTLSKEGYDTWSKTIDVREGLLYRLHYPRLFLNDREIESVASMNDVAFASVSPDRNAMLLINDTYDWSLAILNSDKVSFRKISVRGLFTGAEPAGSQENKTAEAEGTPTLDRQILLADWANDNAHILLKIKKADVIEWYILDVDNVKDSVNLSSKFGMNFDEVKIMNNSASTLITMQDQSLRKIDVNSGQISAVLADKVISLDHYENEIVFVAQKSETTTEDLPDNKPRKDYELNLLEVGNGKVKTLSEMSYPAEVLISKFYDDKYIVTVYKNNVTLYEKNDLKEVEEFKLGFSPAHSKVGHNGEFFIFNRDTDIATLGMEELAVKEWKLDSLSYGWVDNDMVYAVSGEGLVIYDFDGLNRRQIAKNVKEGFPVTITEDKWLYYFSGDNLIREWLIKK